LIELRVSVVPEDIPQHFDTAGDPRLVLDESLTLERRHHLVNRGRADFEIVLHLDDSRSRRFSRV
jgi:hypothetical protein